MAYAELRTFAKRIVTREWNHLDVTGTDVVHEAMVRLIANSKLDLKNPAHLLSVLKRGIRRFLIDQHRRKTTLKREHRESTIGPDSVAGANSQSPLELEDLIETIRRISVRHHRAGRVIELHVFRELALDQTARTLGVSRKSAVEDWATAKQLVAESVRTGFAANELSGAEVDSA